MNKKLTIGDMLAIIVASFLPRRVKYYAMLDWTNWCPVDTFIIEDKNFAVRIEKVLK
jgi:hypothetical protein